MSAALIVVGGVALLLAADARHASPWASRTMFLIAAALIGAGLWMLTS